MAEGRLASYGLLLLFPYLLLVYRMSSYLDLSHVHVSEHHTAMSEGFREHVGDPPPSLEVPAPLSTPAPVSVNATSPEILKQMRYWEYAAEPVRPSSGLDWPARPSERGFVTFEFDRGGFNNIRMSFEIVYLFALATNRTLVIPPRQQMYLLHKPSEWSDYYDMVALSGAVEIMTMEEYLAYRGVKIEYGFKTYQDLEPLRKYIRESADVSPTWKAGDHVLALPSIAACSPGPADFFNLEEFRDGRKLVEVDESMQKAAVVHFKSTKESQEFRIFGNYFVFLYFARAEWFHFASATVRRYVHFSTKVVDTAAAVVTRLHAESGGTGFYALHIRRGDFQFQNTRIDLGEILANIRPLLTPRRLIYIATDERNRTLFEPFTREYDVRFLSDYVVQLKGVERRLYGAIEMSICSTAHTFVGTFLSTFSAMITRLRAYTSADLAVNKNFYLTTEKYSGDPEADNRLTDSTWMAYHEPQWHHGIVWTREFAYSWHGAEYMKTLLQSNATVTK